MFSGEREHRCKDSAPGVKRASHKSRDLLLLLCCRECCSHPGNAAVTQGKDSSGLTWDGVIQDEGDAAPDKHGCGEQDVQHLINACYSCSNKENLLGFFIIQILLIYTQGQAGTLVPEFSEGFAQKGFWKSCGD